MANTMVNCIKRAENKANANLHKGQQKDTNRRKDTSGYKPGTKVHRDHSKPTHVTDTLLHHKNKSKKQNKKKAQHCTCK